MVGTQNSGNPYRIDILFQKPIGEVILSIISDMDYGKGTFAGKCVLEVLKDEIIKRKGQEFFDQWHAKWSLTQTQQNALSMQTEKEKHDRLVAQYSSLGQNSQVAENLALAFPDSNPLEVIKIRTYANQTEIAKEKFEEPKREQERHKIEYELRKRERFLEDQKRNNRTSDYTKQVENEVAELKQKLKEVR
jgi:hypothetical protein